MTAPAPGRNPTRSAASAGSRRFAAPVAFLASDAAACVCGALVEITGVQAVA